MKTIIRALTNPENIFSYALGFVVAWFGLNEIFAPQEWVTFVPKFLGDGTFALIMVVIHGIILTSCALLLFFKIYRKIAAGILALMFAQIIIELITQTGLSDIAVRDIGLCGTAIGLVLLAPFRSTIKQNP